MEVVEQGVAVGGLPDLDEKKRKVKHRLRQLISVQGLVLGVIALGVIIRFYYFSLTKNQAHWWDSLGYGSIAKQIVYGLWGDNAFLATETIIRPPLLPLLWSILIRFGASDVFSVFVFGIIPSVASVVFIVVSFVYNSYFFCHSFSIFLWYCRCVIYCVFNCYLWF